MTDWKYLLYNNKAVTSQGRAMVACRAHNPEVVGSSPTPATKKFWRRSLVGPERPVHTRQVGGSNPPAATKILWLHGQEVKTSPFQGGIASSILAGVTNQKNTVKYDFHSIFLCIF